MTEVRSTVTSSVLNLIKNVIAAGIVTLPYVLRECSTTVGLAAMLCVSLLTAHSFWTLAVCVAQTHAPTYQALANLLFGPRWAWCALVVLICYTLMSEISFIVVIGDFIVPTLQHLGLRGWLASRAVVQNVIAVFMLFPLSLLKDLHPLRHMSLIGMVCILYAVAVIVIEGWPSLGSPEPSVEHLSLDTSVFKGLAILSIAFAAQYSIPKLVLELGVTQRSKFRRVILIETGVVLLLYIAAAVCGYLKFGEATDGDIFHNLSHANYILVAKLSLGVSAIGCFPFPFQVLRSSLNEAFRLPTGRTFQALFTLGLILFCAGVALAIPKIELVLAFKGSLFGSLVVYVFPGLFAWRVRQLDPQALRLVQERFRLMRALQLGHFKVEGVCARDADVLRGEDKEYLLDHDQNLPVTVGLLGADFDSNPLVLSTQEESLGHQDSSKPKLVITWGRLRRAAATWGSNGESDGLGGGDEDATAEGAGGVVCGQGLDDQELVDTEGRVRLPPGVRFNKIPSSEMAMPWFLVVFGVVTGIVGFVVTILKMTT